MATQDIKLLNAYGHADIYRGVGSANLIKSDDNPVVLYDTSDAENNQPGKKILQGSTFYGRNGPINGEIRTYTGPYANNQEAMTLETGGKYCTNNINITIPSGTVPAYTINYYKNETDPSPYYQECVLAGGGQQITAPPAPNPAGHSGVFLGWREREENELTVFPVTPTNNLDFIAQYKSNNEIVVGVTGLGRSSGKLTLTDDAAASGGYELETRGRYTMVVNNRLDALFPFNSIIKETNTFGDTFIRIPKMYMKYDVNSSGHITGVHFAKSPNPESITDDADGWFLPQCFWQSDGGPWSSSGADPRDPASAHSYVYLGRYEMGRRNGTIACYPDCPVWTGSKANCAGFIAVQYGANSGYSQMTLSISALYNFLCMVYLQDSNPQYHLFPGRVGSGRDFSYSGSMNTGVGDKIEAGFSYSGAIGTGWDAITGGCEILGVENPFGNVWSWLEDAVFANGKELYLLSSGFPQTYIGSCPDGQEVWIKALSSGQAGGGGGYQWDYRSQVYPVAGGGGGYSTYFGDEFTTVGAQGVDCACGGGYTNINTAGLQRWTVETQGTSDDDFGSRLCYRGSSLS